MEFKKITIEDKPWIDNILKKKKHLSCEYCFGNHFIWKNAYDVEIIQFSEGFFVASLMNDEGVDGRSFLYPAGVGNVKPVIEQLLDYCSQNKIEFRMHSATFEDKQELDRLFPGKFECTADRDYADYIYNASDLTNLSGKKYHGKRNHIARFKERDWSFEPITSDNFAECQEMNELWCVENNCGMDPDIIQECCAVKRSFKYFNELGFFGGLLRVDGRVVAYTFAEALNEEVVAVHMEKAFSDIQGAYAAINREFVANMCQSYLYINREEDLGVEGLRKAKLSYHPAILLEKYSVKLA